MFSTLVSIVVLIGAVWLLFVLLYKDPISRQKRAIEEAAKLDLKSELIRKFRAANDFIITKLQKALEAIKAAFGGKHPVPDYDLQHKAQVLRGLSRVGIVIDWFIQWLVNQRMLVFSPWIWLALSLPVALAITWLTELASFGLTCDANRPARGERICRDATVVTGVMSLTALLLFLYGRTASASSVNEWLIAVISGSLWIVAEGLGVACGFAAAWALHLDRAGRAFRKAQKLERQLEPRYQFRTWLDAQQAQSQAGRPSQPESSKAESEPKVRPAETETNSSSVIPFANTAQGTAAPREDRR